MLCSKLLGHEQAAVLRPLRLLKSNGCILINVELILTQVLTNPGLSEIHQGQAHISTLFTASISIQMEIC